MSARRTILLNSAGAPHYDEGTTKVAHKPGHLVEWASDGKLRPHTTVGGPAAPNFAYETNFLGGSGVDGTYAVGSNSFIVHAKRGDRINARVAAACAAVTIGTFLDSAGDGTLAPISADGSRTLYVNTAASAAVSNTASITAFDKSYTIAANTLAAGDILRIKFQGILTATTSSHTLTVTLKIGTTTIVANLGPDATNDDIFQGECDLVIRDIGATGHFVASGWTLNGPPATAEQISFFLASTAIDTTTSKAITVSATWSSASSSDSVRLDILTIEIIRASGSRNSVAVAREAVDNSAGITEAFIDVEVL